ncbi:hypothetical protein [Rivihabitans pingtungensis]|uniref:hypothetical protein n=1 Tax=Rivihabitans pingtungensis TaxID=1054498 RepID=UPI0023572DC1|nr:hypothetical protein [Rivihabitans pingtungensis]MCK6436033.1 hypothetical protein [Rivihabitans pingtungensis]
MVKPACAVPDMALLPLRELVFSLLLLDTLIATLLTLILPLSTFWVNMAYSHLIGACICTLTEVGRRLLWTRCGWPSPWRFGLLLVGCTVLGASLGATLAGWVTHFSLHEGVLSRNRRKFRQPINVACPAPGRWGRPNSRVTSRHFDHGNASRTSRPDCSGLDEAD